MTRRDKQQHIKTEFNEVEPEKQLMKLKFGSMGTNKTNESLDEITTLKRVGEEERSEERGQWREGIISPIAYKVTSSVILKIMKGQ